MITARTTTNCSHCSDTGSLSKHVWGHLDCPHCDVVQQRLDLENWYRTIAKPMQLDVMEMVWIAVLRDRQINQGEKK